MKIDIKATKIDLTEDLKDYIQKKMDMLDKYLGSFSVVECYVDLSLAVGGQKTGRIYRTEVVMKLPKTTLVVEKIESDIMKSVDKVKDQLAEAIVQYKEKMQDRRRQAE